MRCCEGGEEMHRRNYSKMDDDQMVNTKECKGKKLDSTIPTWPNRPVCVTMLPLRARIP